MFYLLLTCLLFHDPDKKCFFFHFRVLGPVNWSMGTQTMISFLAVNLQWDNIAVLVESLLYRSIKL